MKIYTEVNFEWNEEEQKMVEVSSESYDYEGELALCYCGQYKGDDKAGNADRKMMETGKSTLDDIFKMYQKNSDPFDSFYANEIERAAKTAADKKGEAEDRFNLMRDQKQESFRMAQQKGAQSFEQARANTVKQLQTMQTKATREAEGMRTDAAADAYAMGLSTGRGGMAGTGGRMQRVMAERAKRTVGGVGLELATAREQAKDSLREQESTLNMNMSEQAMGLSQATEAAEQEMNQTKDNLAREQEAFAAKMLQEQSSQLDNLRSEARGTVSALQGSYMNPHSSWGSPGGVDAKFNGGGFEPDWAKPFDDWDEEQGLDTGWGDD